ncbi:unnamed protein product, partial [Scytosiphon promiscuus]
SRAALKFSSRPHALPPPTLSSSSISRHAASLLWQGKKGDVLAERYEIIGDVGLGTFGRVVECWCMKRERFVAVKVVRKVAKYHESALIEAQILRDVNLQERNIRRGSSDSSLCVEMFAQFEHQVRLAS